MSFGEKKLIRDEFRQTVKKKIHDKADRMTGIGCIRIFFLPQLQRCLVLDKIIITIIIIVAYEIIHRLRQHVLMYDVRIPTKYTYNLNTTVKRDFGIVNASRVCAVRVIVTSV